MRVRRGVEVVDALLQRCQHIGQTVPRVLWKCSPSGTPGCAALVSSTSWVTFVGVAIPVVAVCNQSAPSAPTGSPTHRRWGKPQAGSLASQAWKESSRARKVPDSPIWAAQERRALLPVLGATALAAFVVAALVIGSLTPSTPTRSPSMVSANSNHSTSSSGRLMGVARVWVVHLGAEGA